IPIKLRSGLYAQLHRIEGHNVALINGFIPGQIARYYTDGAFIVVMLLASELPWLILRDRMAGDTFPARASPGSIRRMLYDDAATLGIPPPTVDTNCIHLSAGPFEALFEIQNMLAPLGDATYFKETQTTMGRLMSRFGVASHIHAVLQNPEVKCPGGIERLF